MAKYAIEEITLTSIADAIRSKTGSTAPIVAGNMPEQISALVVSPDYDRSATTTAAKVQSTYDHNAPELHHGGIIPEGATYTVKTTGEVLTSGMAFPDASAKNDIYAYGDYEYTYEVKSTREGWKVSTVDKNKETYEAILESINGVDIVSLQFTFNSCAMLTKPPAIPANVKNLAGAFKNCTSLVEATFDIPVTVTDMAQVFSGCTALTTAPDISKLVNLIYFEVAFHSCSNLKTYVGAPWRAVDGDFSAFIIPDHVTDMTQTFYTCSSLTCAPTIPASVTDMDGTFVDCTSLTGAVIVHATPTKYDSCFRGTGITAIVGDCVNTGMNGTLWETK